MRPALAAGAAAILAAASLTATVATPAGAHQPDGPSVGTDRSNGALRMNHVQALGMHAAHHQDPRWPGREQIRADHHQRPVWQQLEHQDVRQLELDVHWNWARQEFEVYGAWLIDDRTTCELLQECLSEVRRWSDAHPEHIPIMVVIDIEDSPAVDPSGGYGQRPNPEDLDPLTSPVGEAEYQRLDHVLLASFATGGGDRVITPDEVRQPPKTLQQTILTDGWPLLDDARQHVFFVLDGADHHRDDYSRGQTTLQGRAMFVDAVEMSPVAAVVRRGGTGNPADSLPGCRGTDPHYEQIYRTYPRIECVVQHGFIVRDVVDPDRNTWHLDSFPAGSTYVSSVNPDAIRGFVNANGHHPVRCNPQFRLATGCSDGQLEVHAAGARPPQAPDGYADVVADKLDRVVVRTVTAAAVFVARTIGL